MPDVNTILLIESKDEAEGSTNFVDLSDNDYGITPQRTITHSQDVGSPSGLGASAIKTNGNGYLETLDDFPTLFYSDFTVEFWAYSTSTSTNFAFGQWSDSDTILPLGIWAGFSAWALRFGGQNNIFGSNAASYRNIWTHIAVESYDGTIYTYQDGIAKFSRVLAASVVTNPRTLTIGTSSRNSTSEFRSYLQQIRVSSVARYQGANFTPPDTFFSSAITEVEPKLFTPATKTIIVSDNWTTRPTVERSYIPATLTITPTEVVVPTIARSYAFAQKIVQASSPVVPTIAREYAVPSSTKSAGTWVRAITERAYSPPTAQISPIPVAERVIVWRSYTQPTATINASQVETAITLREYSKPIKQYSTGDLKVLSTLRSYTKPTKTIIPVAEKATILRSYVPPFKIFDVRGSSTLVTDRNYTPAMHTISSSDLENVKTIRGYTPATYTVSTNTASRVSTLREYARPSKIFSVNNFYVPTIARDYISPDKTINVSAISRVATERSYIPASHTISSSSVKIPAVSRSYIAPSKTYSVSDSSILATNRTYTPASLIIFGNMDRVNVLRAYSAASQTLSAASLERVTTLRSYSRPFKTISVDTMQVPTIARSYLPAEKTIQAEIQERAQILRSYSSALMTIQASDVHIPVIDRTYTPATKTIETNTWAKVSVLRDYESATITIIQSDFKRIINLDTASWRWETSSLSTNVEYVSVTDIPQWDLEIGQAVSHLILYSDLNSVSWNWQANTLESIILMFVNLQTQPTYDFVASRLFSQINRVSQLISPSYHFVPSILEVNPETSVELVTSNINWRSSYVIANSTYSTSVDLSREKFDFYIGKDLLTVVSEIDTLVLLSEESYDIFTLEDIIVNGLAASNEIAETADSPLSPSIIENNGLMPNDDYTITDKQFREGVEFRPIFDFASDLPEMSRVANSCTPPPPENDPPRWELQSFDVSVSMSSPVYTGSMKFKRVGSDEKPFTMPAYANNSMIRMSINNADIDTENYYNGARGGQTYYFNIANMSTGDDGSLSLSLNSLSAIGANQKIPRNIRVGWSAGSAEVANSKSTESKDVDVWKRKKTDRKKLVWKGTSKGWTIQPVYETTKERVTKKWTKLTQKVTFPNAGYKTINTRRWYNAANTYKYIRTIARYTGWRLKYDVNFFPGGFSYSPIWRMYTSPFPAVPKEGGIINKGQTYLDFANSLAQEGGYTPIYFPDLNLQSVKPIVKYLAADKAEYLNLDHSQIEFQKVEEDEVLGSRMENIFSESLSVNFSNMRDGVVLSFGEKPAPKERTYTRKGRLWAINWNRKEFGLESGDPPVREYETEVTRPAVPHSDTKYVWSRGNDRKAHFASYDKNQSSFSVSQTLNNLYGRFRKPDWSYEVEMKLRPSIKLTENAYDLGGEIRAPVTNYTHSLDFANNKARTRVSVGQEIF